MMNPASLPYYEVRFEISVEDPYNFHNWLKGEHMADLRALKHDFGSGIEAIFDSFEVGEEPQKEGVETKVLYLRCFARDKSRFDVYIEQYLPLMREKGAEHHGEGLENGEIVILGVSSPGS